MIQYFFGGDWSLGRASTDMQQDRGNSSRLYKANIWMWCYGSGSFRMVSRAAETRKRHNEATAVGAAGYGSIAD
jgi:hypothetical protein